MPSGPSGALQDLASLCFIHVHYLWTFKTVFLSPRHSFGAHSYFIGRDHSVNNLPSFSSTTIPKLTSLHPQHLHGFCFLYEKNITSS